jgi:MFS family permease
LFLTVSRFVYGLAIGAFSVFVPKFISETTPTELKGPYGGISQIMCCIGILLPSLLALAIPQPLNSISASTDPTLRVIYKDSDSFLVTEYWRIICGLPIVIALLQLCLIQYFFNFESP